MGQAGNDARPEVKKRSLSLKGHRTAVALEPEFWVEVERLAAEAGQSLAGYIAAIDETRPAGRSLASALRLATLSALRRTARGEHPRA